MSPTRQPAIFFITGASASGKTTLLTLLAQQDALPGASYHLFDSIGIPAADVMQRDFGGPDRWQEHATYQWVERLLALPDTLAVIEGQTRPRFIQAAFRRAGVIHGGILLLDCGTEERRRRLQIDRAQPELANFQMFAWAAYLRGQADALDLPVLDTSALAPADACRALATSIERFACLRAGCAAAPTTVRPATAHDVPAILPLWRELMETHAALDPLYRLAPDAAAQAAGHLQAELASPASLCLVAARGPAVVGYCRASVRQRSEIFARRAHGFISELHVSSSCRRQGVGRELVGHARRWFAERGVDRLEVFILAANHDSQAFWKHVGCEPRLSVAELSLRPPADPG